MKFESFKLKEIWIFNIYYLWLKCDSIMAQLCLSCEITKTYLGDYSRGEQRQNDESITGIENPHAHREWHRWCFVLFLKIKLIN